MVTASPAEVQAVKDALARDVNNVGVGVVHEPTGRVYLKPFDDLPMGGGHQELASLTQLPLGECKGFVIGLLHGGYVVVNSSHLNGPQGQPGSLQMPAPLFLDIEQALRAAGL
jgi:hypothetical protein